MANVSLIKWMLGKWTEYCSELYSHKAEGDDAVLAVNEPTDQDSFPILESEVESAIRVLKIGKSPGVDNIPSELLKSGGDILKKLLRISVTKYGKPEYGHLNGQSH